MTEGRINLDDKNTIRGVSDRVPNTPFRPGINGSIKIKISRNGNKNWILVRPFFSFSNPIRLKF